MDREIIIIGGGLAGLSTAIYAIKNNYLPIILERNKHLGGRVRSLSALNFPGTIDNGQHVLSAAYAHTKAYLNLIGNYSQVDFQKKFFTHFVQSPEAQYSFAAANWPGPLHFLAPLLKGRSFFKQKFLPLIRSGLNLMQSNPEELKKLTVEQWMRQLEMDSNLVELLFKPITLAVLNTPVESASAWLLFSTLKQSFLNSAQKAALGIPKNWLSEIFVNGAETFIEKNGGSIYRMEVCEKLIPERDKISQVATKKQTFDSPNVVLAVPPFAVEKLINKSQISSLNNLAQTAAAFSYHPILTINIILENKIDSPFPIAVLDSPIQWIFEFPQNSQLENGFGYTLVISAADEFNHSTHDELLQLVYEELIKRLNVDISGTHQLLHYKVVKEKRATIAQTPDSILLRPETNTPLANLFLAGDWTETGLPATIESAILSGKTAVDAILTAKESYNNRTR